MTEENITPAAASNGQANPNAGPQLVLHKLYLKDVSFEAPGAPQIFQDRSEGQVQLQMNQKVSNFQDELYEVVLTVTVTCKMSEKTAYLAEIQQAGVFQISGLAREQIDQVIGTYCPNVLFPYARQMISELVQNGGFPPFLLQPINFDQIYAEQQRRQAEGGAAAAEQAPTQG